MGEEGRVRGCRYCRLGVQNHGLVAHNTNKSSTQLLRNRVLWQESLITLLLLPVIVYFTAVDIHCCDVMVLAIVSSELISIFPT
jgi:hypothetical protein